MDIIAYINGIVYKYLTIDNIVEYSSIILLVLVILNFWGKSWVMEQVNRAKDYYSKGGFIE